MASIREEGGKKDLFNVTESPAKPKEWSFKYSNPLVDVNIGSDEMSSPKMTEKLKLRLLR